MLTDAQIKSLRPSKKRFIKFEDSGLGVRVFPSGKKSFVIMYRFNDKQRMMTLGTYPALTLTKARTKAAKAKETLDEGKDPGAEQIAVKAAHKAAPTVADLVDEYLERYAKPKKRSWKKDERILKSNLIPAPLPGYDPRKCKTIGELKAKDVTKRDIIALLDGIVDREAPIMANRTLEIVRKMFNFAMERDIIPASPCAAISKPGKENRRDRVLTDDEIKTLWSELPKCNMTELTRLAIKFQLLTAQRIGEAAAAEWSEIDLKSNIWTIPGEKAKNGLPHRVPLSTMALELLKAIRIESGSSQYLFPSPRVAIGNMSPSAMGRALFAAIKGEAIKGMKTKYRLKLKDVTPHDLRRTAATKMTEAGIDRLVVGKVLNHAESGVTAVYDRHAYDNEKRMALDTWARKLESIITGKGEGKVIPMRKGEKA